MGAINKRLTIRELQETERRIMTELKPLSAMIHRVERNEKEEPAKPQGWELVSNLFAKVGQWVNSINV